MYDVPTHFLNMTQKLQITLDISMIVLMIVNSLDRPRHAQDLLTRSLLNDGIVVLVVGIVSFSFDEH